MTRLDIFKQSIMKAQANGWDELDRWEYIFGVDYQGWPYLLTTGEHHPITCGYASVIFNHDFAKALWGDDEWEDCKVCHRAHYDDTDMNDNMRPDHCHLQQMVIADDPIKYLGDNI